MACILRTVRGKKPAPPFSSPGHPKIESQSRGHESATPLTRYGHDVEDGSFIAAPETSGPTSAYRIPESPIVAPVRG